MLNSLSKESSESEIKAYFNAVLELSKSDNEFPINLDDVWPLVYPRKDHAIRELVDGNYFVQGVDYQVFPKNGENPKGGRPTNEYYLTVSCMEYFIARKVRPVFDVYREVFHRTAEVLAPCVQASHDREERLHELRELLAICRNVGIRTVDTRPVAEELSACISTVSELSDTLERLKGTHESIRQLLVLKFVENYGIHIDTEDPLASSYEFYKNAWEDFYKEKLNY